MAAYPTTRTDGELFTDLCNAEAMVEAMDVSDEYLNIDPMVRLTFVDEEGTEQTFVVAVMRETE